LTTVTTGPVVAVFIEAINTRQSASAGIEHMIAEGKLGALAGELTDLADTVTKSNYVPRARRDEYESLLKSADRTTDREAAAHYRRRASAIRNQLGEGQIHD
jgi:hypothetical protein